MFLLEGRRGNKAVFPAPTVDLSFSPPDECGDGLTACGALHPHPHRNDLERYSISLDNAILGATDIRYIWQNLGYIRSIRGRTLDVMGRHLYISYVISPSAFLRPFHHFLIAQ